MKKTRKSVKLSKCDFRIKARSMVKVVSVKINGVESLCKMQKEGNGSLKVSTCWFFISEFRPEGRRHKMAI